VKILFQCRSLFKFELRCGKMENINATRSLKRQLDHVVLHEQAEMVLPLVTI
jgi:hypothetical protein